MHLKDPIQSIIPSGRGVVLQILARTDTPLSGRMIAELAGGRVGKSRVNVVLRELVESGIVLRAEHPPAHLYVLNRDHVTAEAIQALANLRDALLERMRKDIEGWSTRPVAVWAFGSFARGEGDAESDIDILVLAPYEVDDQAEWDRQLDQLGENVFRWSGNDCRIVEYQEAEFEEMLDRGDRLAVEAVRDASHLAGRRPPRRRTRRVSAS